MNISDLKTKVLEEIQLVPDDQLVDLYNLVHSFRLQFNSSSPQARDLMQFAGCWSDLSTETYAKLLDDLAQRRQQAFSQRQNREANFD